MAHQKSKSNPINKIAIILLLVAAIYFIWHQYQLYVNHGFQHEIIANRPADFNKFGIDVSHHQGDIDWEDLLVKNEQDSIISFVYFKVSEGNNHMDTKWKENRELLRKFYKRSGAYHFFLPSKDAELQAKNFLEHYSHEEGDLPPVIDVEVNAINDRKLIEGVKEWLTEVEKKTGVKPMIYTSLHFYQTKFKSEFHDYKFWIASYSRMPQLENDKRIVIWQYSEKGRLPGIDGKVDLNVAKAF